MSASSRLSPAVAALCLVLALGACAVSDGSPSDGSAADDSSVAPSGGSGGSYEVSSTTLEFEDTSRPTVPDPETGTGQADSRRLPTTIWFPTEGDGPFPVIVFSHGRDSTPEAYTALLQSWSATGFVVAAPRFPLTSDGSLDVIEDVVNQSADVSFVLTQVLALNEEPGAEVEGRIDGEHVAVAGHSAGAVTTIGLLTSCCTDARIDAAIALAGAPLNFILPRYTAADDVRFTTPGMPTLFLHGAADEPIPIAEGEAIYREVPGPKAFVTLADGTHSAPYNNHQDPDWPTVRAVTTDYLHWALNGEDAALEDLRSDVATSGRATLADDQLGG